MIKWVLLVGVLAVALLSAPGLLTGRLLVSDAPVPPGWDDAVATAGDAVHADLDGIYGLRFAGLGCRAGITVVLFDVLGPIAPTRAVMASTSNPWETSDPRWQVQVLDAMGDQADAASFLRPTDAPCRA